MHSCIYEGRVGHCRYEPIVHKFWYRLYMAYLDLNEVQNLSAVRSMLPSRKLALASFREQDHLSGHEGTLDVAVKNLVESETGVRPAGPVRLLTQLRHCGYYFSPLCLFYCFDRDGTTVEAIVGEVNNTPWREQHHYVLSDANRVDGASQKLCYSHDKAFHVSPFLEMDYRYHWQLGVPGEQLSVNLENWRQGKRKFSASMRLAKRDLSRIELTKMMLRHPVMTAEIMAAIHWQAFRLWWKKCPVYLHPARQTKSPSTSS